MMPSIKIPKTLVLLVIVLAVIGLGVATYLTIEHLRGETPDCSVLEGCQAVLSSKYAEVGPIPTGVFGVFYYSTIIILAVLYLGYGNLVMMKLLGWLSAVGFVVSILLIYVQMGIIHAMCIYCMTSALVSILIFIIDLIIWRKYLSGPKKPNTVTA